MFNLLSIMGNPATSQPYTYTGFYLEDVSGQANSVSIRKGDANAPTLTIETSADGQTWSTLGQTDTTALIISIPANSKVYVRCTANSWGDSSSAYNFFNAATGNFKVGGNVMSLLYGSNFTGSETSFPSGSTYNFNGLFNINTYLTDASDLELPADTLTNYCYNAMFNGCSNLATAPALPATTLASNCYNGMFNNCTSLTTAPALPATTLATYCYNGMFLGCTALTQAPALNATTLVNFCYSYMFSGCTALTQAPALPATTLANYCYRGMFNGCTSLTATPTLPATTLATQCYKSMFENCTSLTVAPTLNASTFANNSYNSMFKNCTSLNSVTVGSTTWDAANVSNDWLYGVSPTGTFTKPSATNIPEGTNGIPSGWTVINI